MLGIFPFSIDPNAGDCIFASAQEINAELDKIIIALLVFIHLTALSIAVLIQCLSVLPFSLLGHSLGIST